MAKRDSFLFRLPPEMLDALRKWAEDELRSANSQLELVLQNALKAAGRLPHPTTSNQSSPQPSPRSDEFGSDSTSNGPSSE